MSVSELGAVARAAQQAQLRVAIDGPSGGGKSTLGRNLAAALGCCYLDTGLMYRAVTAQALRRHVQLDDTQALATLADDMRFEFGGADGSQLFVDGRPAGEDLRSADIDAHVSRVSAVPGVREAMVRRQRALAAGRCFVMVGRDIGTTVLPDAEVKIWVVASPEERARRRFHEHLAGSSGLTLRELAEQIRERDYHDSHRPVSPLRRAEDAQTIDTDGVSPDEVAARAIDIVARTLQAPKVDRH